MMFGINMWSLIVTTVSMVVAGENENYLLLSYTVLCIIHVSSHCIANLSTFIPFLRRNPLDYGIHACESLSAMVQCDLCDLRVCGTVFYIHHDQGVWTSSFYCYYDYPTGK
jgi:hypothetical protein